MADTELTEEAVKELLIWVKATAETVSDFAVEQGPLLVQETIDLGMVSAIMGIVLGVVCLILTVPCLWYQITKIDKYDFPFAGFGAGIFAVIGLIAIPANIYQYVAISIAPRVYILQQLGNIF